MRSEHPDEQCSHTESVERRSNGRARKRYDAPVSAPTGQICTVLPEKYDWNGTSSLVPICCSAPRSSRSMNGSPAICSENRVQRWHSTQRSRSSSTFDEIAIGFGKVRFFSRNRLSAPLSQIGQSSGWLISSSSMTPCCALSATADVYCVAIFMPGITVVVHA